MQISDTFLKHFEPLADPRVDNHNKLHKLHDILVITILATICGADNWVDINEFGEAKYDWLSTFLELPNGVPSHDTFGRVFSILDSEQFESCFCAWIKSLWSCPICRTGAYEKIRLFIPPVSGGHFLGSKQTPQVSDSLKNYEAYESYILAAKLQS